MGFGFLLKLIFRAPTEFAFFWDDMDPAANFVGRMARRLTQLEAIAATL